MRQLVTLTLAAVVAAPTLANPAHNQIQALDEPTRHAIFGKLLIKEDNGCRTTNRTFFQGLDKAGHAYWNVTCSKGKRLKKSSLVVGISEHLCRSIPWLRKDFPLSAY